MTVKQKLWIAGLIDSTVNAVGVAAAGSLGGEVVGHPIDHRVLSVMCAWAAAWNLRAYMKQHPLEDLIETKVITTTTVAPAASVTTVQTETTAVQSSVVPSPVVPAAGAKEE